MRSQEEQPQEPLDRALILDQASIKATNAALDAQRNLSALREAIELAERALRTLQGASIESRLILAANTLVSTLRMQEFALEERAEILEALSDEAWEASN